MDNDNENQDSLKPEELAQLSEKVEKGEGLTEEEATKLVIALPNLKKTVDGLYKRAKTAEEDLTKYKTENPPAAAPGVSPEAKAAAPTEVKPTGEISATDLLEFSKKGLSNLEIASLVEEAKNLGVPLSKFADSNLFQPWLDVQRAKAKVEGATPSPSSPVSFAEAAKEKTSFVDWKSKQRRGE